MRIGLFTILRHDMLEHFKVAKDYDMEIDILITGKAPRRPYIHSNTLNERIYRDEVDLLNILGEYDVTSAYGFYDLTQMKIMERYDNFIPEVAWNIPTYGTGFDSDNWRPKCLDLIKKKVKGLIARSQSIYDFFIQEGISKDKIGLVWGVCDTNRFKPNTKPDEFKNKLVFLFMGRCVERKGIFEIFHSFYRANIPNSILIYIGNGASGNPWALNLVKRWVDVLKMKDKVFFYNKVSEEDVPRHFNWGDVFITLPNTNPKFMEQIGMTVPQALASGLPVITYDYGGQAGFIDDTCGIKIPHKDYVAGATAMISLADKTIRDRMSIAARAKAISQYDIHNYAKGIKKVYEKALI